MKTKHLFISLIVFPIFLSSVKAQNAPLANPSKTDSLQQLVDGHNKDDEEKVRLLNEYARQCFYDNEIQKGFIATRDARILSEKLNFEGGKVMYYLTLATYFGNDEMNEYYLNQAEWLSKSPDKQLDKYYIDLPKIDYDYGSNYEVLINEFTSILQHFKQLGDKEIQACLISKMVNFNYWLAKTEERIRLNDQLISLYTDLGQLYPAFLFMTYKMSDLNLLGRKDEAKKIELELIEFITKNIDNNAIGHIALSMGRGYGRSGRNALAIEYYLKSIAAFEGTGDLKNAWVDILSDGIIL